MTVHRTLFASELRDLLQKAIDKYGDKPILVDDADTGWALLCVDLNTEGHKYFKECFVIESGNYDNNVWDGEDKKEGATLKRMG